jgi:antitoxin YefM
MCNFLKPISITNGIIPIAEFKASISKCFKQLHKVGYPLVITQNGKPVGVLLTPRDYDALVAEENYRDPAEAGMTDVEDDKNFSKVKSKTILGSRRNGQ